MFVASRRSMSPGPEPRVGLRLQPGAFWSSGHRPLAMLRLGDSEQATGSVFTQKEATRTSRPLRSERGRRVLLAFSGSPLSKLLKELSESRPSAQDSGQHALKRQLHIHGLTRSD